MRILAITARYPPHHLGGYEIRNRDVVDALARKGHEVLVITSQRETASGPPHRTTSYKVLRELHVRGTGRGLADRLARARATHAIGMLLVFARELALDLQDLAFVDNQSKRFRPDVIYLGHITCLSRSIIPYLAGQRTPLVYDEGGSGLIDCWDEKNMWYRFVGEHASRLPVVNAIKRLAVGLVCSASAERLKPRFAWPYDMHVFFNGELNQRNAIAKGVPADGAKVIRSGVDTKEFSFSRREGLGSPLLVIVPGRIEPRKGQMDGIRLLANLTECGIAATMIIVGSTWSESYYGELADEIKKLHLESRARLMPAVTQGELAALYQKADVCFFPSHYRTGFSRVPLEAMASGCITVSYGNEGSDEVIRNKHNGFLVQPAGFQEIASIIKELKSDPRRVRDMAVVARNEVEAEFSLERYVDRIERLITDAAGVPPVS